MLRGLKPLVTAAILAVPLLGWAGGAAETSCLRLADEFSLVEPPRSVVEAHSAVVEVLKTDPNSTRVECNRHGADRLSLSVEIGQRLEFRVLISHPSSQQAAVNWASPADWPEWLSLASLETPYPELTSITLNIDARGLDEAVATILPILLRSDSGDIQHPLALQVEPGEESPLFRNRFEVEPLPGQFSHSPSEPRYYASITLAALP